MELLDLPDEVIDNIFSYLKFAELSTNREVCTRFNRLCGAKLNRGFINAEKFHTLTLKSIKSKLPKRESERRNHPLAKHCDILTAIETRLSMLSITYQKWIEAKVCPFIPGKVLDEMMNVLRDLNNFYVPRIPRAHDMLLELRDISSMAMEHFDEVVTPLLKKKMGSLRKGYLLPDSLKFRQISFVDQKYVTFQEFSKFVMLESATKRKVKEQDSEIRELRKQIGQLEARLCGINPDQTSNLNKIDTLDSKPGKSSDEPDTKMSNLKRSSLQVPCCSKKFKTSLNNHYF